jgi:hypothetical protein
MSIKNLLKPRAHPLLECRSISLRVLMGTCWDSMPRHNTVQHSPWRPVQLMRCSALYLSMEAHETLFPGNTEAWEVSEAVDICGKTYWLFPLLCLWHWLLFRSQPLSPLVPKHCQSSALPGSTLRIRLPAPSFHAGMAGVRVNCNFQAATRNDASEVLPKTFTLIKVWDCFNISWEQLYF